LARFNKLSYDFTDNPLHLQLISETEGIEERELVDVISVYEQFLNNKIKHGLLTCRQIEEISSEFKIKNTRILSILTKCAVAQVLENKEMVVSLDNREVMDINLSGVATVVDKKSPLTFVSRTFAEFLTAQHFMQMCFEPPPDDDQDVVEIELDVHKLFHEGVSYQTMRFIEDFLDTKYQGKPMDDDVLESIAEVKKDVFECICQAGMNTLFDILWGGIFDGPMVQQWMVDSHAAADYKDRTMKISRGYYFHACCSSLQLAAKLSEWCPMLQLDDVDSLVECLSTLSKSRLSLEQALSKVTDWNNKWPKAAFFTQQFGSFSANYYEFAFENCPDLGGDSLLQMIYARDFRSSYRDEILPLLLRLGLDVTLEVDGVRVLNMFSHSELFQLAIRVAKHFKHTQDLNSEESQQLRKNVGAQTPQQFGLTVKGRGPYLEHILERACALFDPGTCGPTQSIIATDEQEYEMSKMVREDADLRPIATHFKLRLMRACLSSDEQDALRIFEGEQPFVPRDFRYKCGCTLAHDACSRSDPALLEALIHEGFTVSDTNNEGETPLHKSVQWKTDCTELLLKMFLGRLYDDCSAPRTPDEQASVESALGQRDFQGRTPFLAAALSNIDEGNAQLLLVHLLGPMVLPLDAPPLIRPEAEQRLVETILCDRDLQGFTPLHGALLNNEKLGFLRVLLKNLLGAWFVDAQTDAHRRPLQLQKRIAELLQPRNQEGETPLHSSVRLFNKYQVHELLLRNVLGDYFVEADGTTANAFDVRTKEENQFVRELLLTPDVYGLSPYAICKGSRCDEKVQLLIEANAGYLLQRANQAQ
jgi:ankyrin repeat protein